MIVKYFGKQTLDSITSEIIKTIKILPTDNILAIHKMINDIIEERIRIRLEKTY